MKCNIVLSGENLIDYQAFNLFFSKKARKQYFINVFMIFTEAIIAGFVADMLLKTKIFTIIGVIFAIFWIIFYPIFLKNRRKSVLKSLEISDFKKEMIFEVDEKNLAFYENEPKENEIFDINFNDTEEDTVILAMLRGIMNVAMRNSEFEIKEIEYISETEVNVKLKVKYPDIDKDENRIFKKAEENFKKKTGLTIEQVQMIESEKEKMKYVLEDVFEFMEKIYD